MRERSDTLVRELVLDDPAPFVPFFLTKRKKEIDYEAKAVTLAGRRYIVCRNHDKMRKDAAARAAILAALERELKKGDKALVVNKGYRRFLMKPDDGHFAIDRAKAEEDAKFDGVFVLRTNARLSPREAMLVYKQLWTVELSFKRLKSILRLHRLPAKDPGLARAWIAAHVDYCKQFLCHLNLAHMGTSPAMTENGMEIGDCLVASLLTFTT